MDLPHVSLTGVSLSLDDLPFEHVLCEDLTDEDGGYVNVRTFEEILEDVSSVREGTKTPPSLGPVRYVPPVSPVAVPARATPAPLSSRVSSGSLLWGYAASNASSNAQGANEKRTLTKVDFLAGTKARRGGGSVWVETMTPKRDRTKMRAGVPPNTIVFSGYQSNY